MLKIEDVSISYGRTRIVESVSLDLAASSTCSITGHSGSGKSSIIAAILGFVKPSSGRVMMDGVDLATFGKREWRDYRRRTVSAVFQQGELIGELTPLENVALAPLIAGLPRRSAFERAEAVLEQLGLTATGQLTSTMSGGEQQRIALARALATEPRLIVADEPTAALDLENRLLVSELLYSIPDRWGCAVLIVTHDLTLARAADAMYELVPAPRGGASTWSNVP